MSMHLPETGGFRFIYPKAAAPDVIRSVLEPIAGAVTPFLSGADQSSVTAIEDVGLSVQWARIAAESCVPEIAFALGLDSPSGSERLKAIVCRAFERADAYAEAFFWLKQDVRFAKKAAPDITQALALLIGGVDQPERIFLRNHDGILQKSIGLIDRHQADTRVAKDGFRKDVESAVKTIDRVRRLLNTIPEFEINLKAAPDPRFYFVFRLAELYSMSFGDIPIFNSYEAKLDSSYWHKFVKSSLKLTGLGISNLDDLLRRLGGKGSHQGERDRSRHFEELACRFLPARTVRPVMVLGDLLSTDFEETFRLPPPPARRDEEPVNHRQPASVSLI